MSNEVRDMKISNDIGRRNVVRAAAWAAPVIAVAAATPLVSASVACDPFDQCFYPSSDVGASSTYVYSLTLPPNVTTFTFSIAGGAGAGSGGSGVGGDGALITGVMTMPTGGATLSLVVGSGGIAGSFNGNLKPGGTGYGEGGTAAGLSGSGGGGSAILYAGGALVVAGGGGGVGVASQFAPNPGSVTVGSGGDAGVVAGNGGDSTSSTAHAFGGTGAVGTIGGAAGVPGTPNGNAGRPGGNNGTGLQGGGNGGDGVTANIPGFNATSGGGGGGYAGGGSGGGARVTRTVSGTTYTLGAGGAGGAGTSFISSSAAATFTPGGNAGDLDNGARGYICISYVCP